jgi:ABC-type transport system involved in multi-copper enzyme maturation permease subunit
MALPPLVERELRVGARRRGFYWLRGLLAVAAGFQGYEALSRYALAPAGISTGLAGGPGTAISGLILLRQMAGLLFAAALLMGLSSADSISRERREGTLSLLVLAGLKPAQIVFQKLLCSGLTCFAVLSGCLPALMLPVLAGGVNGAEAAMTGLGLLNTLFVALTAGLWMSARFRERQFVILATLGLLAAATFGAQVFGGAILGPRALPLLRLFELGGWTTIVGLRTMRAPLFLVWFMLMQAAGWIFLARAAATLARHWQDEPREHFAQAEPSSPWEAPGPTAPREAAALGESDAAPVLTRGSWLSEPRPWDADPIRWRAEQMGPVTPLVWLAVGLNFLAQFGVLGSMFNPGGLSAGAWGLRSFSGIMVILFSGVLLAAAGARFFQRTRREQDLELLLTTPVGCRNILAGQWHVLRRALVGPVGAVLAVGLPSGLCLAYHLAKGNGREAFSSLLPLLITVNLSLETLAICWVAMYLGLRGHQVMGAAVWTAGLAQLLPMALAMVLMSSWGLLAPLFSGLSPRHGQDLPQVAALLFFLAKNIALIAWARQRLRRDLRLDARSHLTAAAKFAIAQAG